MSLFKNLRSGISLTDLAGLAATGSGNQRVGVTIPSKNYSPPESGLGRALLKLKYHTLCMEERQRIEESPSRFKYNQNLHEEYQAEKWKKLRESMDAFDRYYMRKAHGHRKSQEEKYTFLAEKLWSAL